MDTCCLDLSWGLRIDSKHTEIIGWKCWHISISRDKQKWIDYEHEKVGLQVLILFTFLFHFFIDRKRQTDNYNWSIFAPWWIFYADNGRNEGAQAKHTHTFLPHWWIYSLIVVWTDVFYKLKFYIAYFFFILTVNKGIQCSFIEVRSSVKEFQCFVEELLGSMKYSRVLWQNT